MVQPAPAVFFYAPSESLVRSVPAALEDYWPWITAFASASPIQLPDGRGACTWLGPYDWTVHTYVQLRHHGFPCELTSRVPPAGIVIAHGDFLPASLRPSPRQFIVEAKPDRPLQCRHANFVVVQNRHDPIRRGAGRLLVESATIPLWPQPGLLPRDPARGDRFETIAYMGNPRQFLEDAPVLEAQIRDLGLRWAMPPPEQWHDYRAVDAAVAVRPLDTAAAKLKESAPFLDPDRKPASKLVNAWRAGVPAIVSPESAHADLRRSELDYLEARTVPDIVARLTRLRDDVPFRRAMADNARQRGVEFQASRNVRAWIDALEERIVPAFIAWSRSPGRRAWFDLSRRASRRVAPIL